MFSATFIGHQGWMLEAGETRILVDPLLAETFGNTPGHEAVLFPPREIQFDRFPAITAVVLTHEHEDHLCPAALDKLSRDIPIFISGNSSAAAVTILQEMGFEAQRLHPGQVLGIGRMNLLAMGPAHERNESNDEWDVIPFLAWDEQGDGSFFTSVDVATTEEMYQRARTYVPVPGVVALGWNSVHMGWRMLEPKEPDAFGLAQSLANNILEAQRRLTRSWGAPAALAITGSGFSLQGDLEWINRNAFVVDAQQVIDGVQQLGIPSVVVAPRPGQALTLGKDRPCRVVSRDYLRTLPRQRWPERSYTGDQPVLPPGYAPACGRREAGPEQKAKLEEHLPDLARFLYGTRVFQELLSLHTDELRERRRSIALVLKRDGDPWVFEYHPHQCRFVERETLNPYSAYPAGIECWATDLLALFEGHVVASSGVGLGRARLWSHVPGKLQGLFTQVFTRFFHPLRRPEAALTMYRRVWANAQERRTDSRRIPRQGA
ncbi:MBL fold metallo-hydrolase [Myxococcus sp. K15C18031901]|uniref:MBL fold metallo-hydrolase n=1 Tax=Myxococcus dinghuensis TaxID=2906761 RepID=UPI0020A7E5F0|nr:MBL fold metallo-hydrolase [Myxococcus dinghuensis]MCP3102952.1 MBL fold metallo-hydrolase [Myxococcus dinghuensis]